MIGRSGIHDFGILILGGGEATRLPGKLALPAGDEPMIARVLRNARAIPCAGTREIVVSAKATFARDLDAALDVPLVIDRWARRGPLGGMLTSFARMRARFVFVVAGDAPLIDAALATRLADAYEPGDEALVPRHAAARGGGLEPLAAIYDRLAFVRAGLPVVRAGRGAIALAIANLRARLVSVDDPHVFANVNTPGDYAALRAHLDQGATP